MTISTIQTNEAVDGRRWHAAWALLACLTLFLAIRPTPGIAQDLAARPLVSEVKFAGNEHFSDLELRGHVRTASNRRFLGIGGVTWWLWLYRLGERGVFGRRIGKALMASGEPPAWLDTATIASDLEQLQSLYRREGFREANIRALIDSTREGAFATVTFDISPGRATVIRRVAYSGLDSLGAASRRRLLGASLLPAAAYDEASNMRYRAQPLRFSEPLLVDERRRLVSTLRDAGYAAVTRDSIKAVITPFSPDSFDVELRIRTGGRFRLGSIHFEVEGPEIERSVRADTLRDAAYQEGRTSELITFRIRQDRKLRPALLERSLQVRPGQWYNQGEILSTKRRLEATGVFSFTDIVPLSPNAAGLPHSITVRTRPRHQARVETFAVQSSGVLGGVGNELGAGLGLTYENVNLFGGGEVLTLSSTASVAADVDSTVFSSAQAGFTTSMSLPYLASPFGRLEESLGLYQARTRFSLSLITARREDLRLIIRGRGAARMRLELRHSPSVTSSVDLLDISLSNPDTLRGFHGRFLSRILGADDSLLVSDPVQRAQILEDYTQPQVNNALRYSFRSENVNPLRRERGYSYEAAIEVGGNLPYLLDRYVLTARRTEGSLPGLPIFGGDNRLNYRQYIRIVGDLRRYQPVGRSTVLALKFVGGWAHPVGRASVVPFDRRFYSGGASSVRGWRLRQLGPGAASFSSGAAADASATNILGGDIKLEASAEVRATVLRNLVGANWILALFTDAGNVWFGPRHPGFPNMTEGSPTGRFALNTFMSEIGIGSGFGVRISWEYLIARFDLAYRIRDPALPEAGFASGGLRDPTAYFRFGHTF